MTTAILPVTERPAWKALERHAKDIAGMHLRKLFADDAQRGTRLTAEALGVYFDYSKNLVTDREARSRELLQRLLDFSQELTAASEVEEAAFSEQELEMLRALGYVGDEEGQAEREFEVIEASDCGFR